MDYENNYQKVKTWPSWPNANRSICLRAKYRWDLGLGGDVKLSAKLPPVKWSR